MGIYYRSTGRFDRLDIQPDPALALGILSTAVFQELSSVAKDDICLSRPRRKEQQ
jgi:hypothetical protein